MALPPLQGLLKTLRRWRTVDVWYHPNYRLPLSHIETTGMEPRRADLAAWFLMESGAAPLDQLHTPRPISWSRLGRVHGTDYLESLLRPETLARIFATHPSEVQVDEVLHTIRLAVGGTVAAMRVAMLRRTHTLNLLGGFHHAGKNRGGGFCPVNDVAVAIAILRTRGFKGQVGVLDLDAHPPDGTADCLAEDKKAWIGSISGSDWGELPRVHEVRLAEGSGDRAYLDALDTLLGRMPKCEVAFVLAGGDVLQGDRHGLLNLTIKGARARDLKVFKHLEDVPTVWLPAGGYHANSWKVLAGTGLVLSGRPKKRIPSRYDPLSARFATISRGLPPSRLSGQENDLELSQDDVDLLLGGRGAPRQVKILGYYTQQGLEFALARYGFLDQLRRLGYTNVTVRADHAGSGDRIRIFGSFDGQEHVLVEAVLERKTVAGAPYLFINWLSLRHPRARFAENRPPLPGQDVPGLGMSREAGELFALIARRLELTGVALRPAWFHVAYASRHWFHFVDPKRQGRFEALRRDLEGVPLLEATQAVADKRVLLDGQPYTWEPEEMISPLVPVAPSPEAVAALEQERERCHFIYPRSVKPVPGPGRPA